jgi:hypothetical protein
MAATSPPSPSGPSHWCSSTIQLTTYVRARPVPGWAACRVSTRYLIDGLYEKDFEIWDTAGQLAAQSPQLALLV